MENRKLILASGSPRRRELLMQIGITDFEIIPADIDEEAINIQDPALLVEELSRQKAAAVASQRPDCLILAADTVVALDGRILGKPRDSKNALYMIMELGGREHHVFTGVTLMAGERAITEHEVTSVSFREVTEEEAVRYVATGEPMDKAGGYGIQGKGALMVARIDGDYFNVMGLPLCKLGKMLDIMSYRW